jgi:hypothetical protein
MFEVFQRRAIPITKLQKQNKNKNKKKIKTGKKKKKSIAQLIMEYIDEFQK